MAGRGGGPSRRSHTKSRKGCKTCKRRHIRCDETFPQCRNCTKHQVRCDYMDLPPVLDDSLRISTQANLRWTPEIERTVDLWRQTGNFPFPELEIYPPPQVKNSSRNEMRLLYHVCSILNDLRHSRTSKLAMWTDIMPKCLGVSASHHFVLHAIYAFGASHLAWEANSNDIRAISADYTNLATRGLQEAMNTFSKVNADGILAASLLLSWLQNDWRNWAFTMSNLKNVVNAMQRFRPDTVFEEFLAQQPIDPLQKFTEETSYPLTPIQRQENLTTIQAVYGSLERLPAAVTLPAEDMKWIEQAQAIIETIRNSPPAQNPKEQFDQLYHFRKLLFWLPVNLLSSRRGDIHSLLLLSHFYAAALSLESAFPDVAAPFIASLAAQPLGDIINIIQACQQTQAFDALAQRAAELMDVPRDALARYRDRRQWAQSQVALQPAVPQFYTSETLGMELATQLAEQSAHTPSLSPAFASTAIHLTPPPITTHPDPRSPFLEVPGSAVDSYGYKPYTPTSGSYQTTPTSAYASSPLISPGFKSDNENSGYQLPLPEYTAVSQPPVDFRSMSMPALGHYAMTSSSGGYGGSTRNSIAGGCVAPTAVWT